MAAPVLTAAAIIIGRDGRPVTHISGQTRVTVSGVAVATCDDAFIGGAGPIAIAAPQAFRVRIGGVPMLSATTVEDAGLRVVSDQTRVRAG